MEIKNEWMTDYSYFGTDYPNNKLLDDAKYRFELQKQSLEGKDALIDGVSERIVAQNHTNPLNQEKYDKKLCFDISSNVHTGSIIEFDSKTYLVTSQIFSKQAYKIGSVLECVNTLNVYKNNTSYQIPCVVESGVRTSQLGTDKNTYIEIPSGTITMRLPNTEITRLIARDEVYQIGLQSWQVKDINDIIEPGLLVFKLEYSQVAQETHVYGITILNGLSISIQEGSNLQLNVQATDNSEIVSSPTLSYASSNELICTVDSSGLVSAIDGGSCVVSVSFNGVSASIAINVIEAVQHNITAEINSGSSTIVLNKTSNYTCVFKDNGVVVPGTSVFYLTADDGTSNTTLATISVQDSALNTCTITAGNTLGYVKLWVRNESGSIVSQPFRIQIKNLF
jgi:hypothetical protein